jgi:hypothetical protein
MNVKQNIKMKKQLKVTTRFDKRSNEHRLKFIKMAIAHSGSDANISHMTRLIFQALDENVKICDLMLQEIKRIVDLDLS